MAEIIAELDRIIAEEMRTNDPAKLEELRKEKSYLKSEYYERMECGK